MNYARIALAAVAATVWDACYGFLVYGMLMAPEFGRYPGVYRGGDGAMAFLALMFAGIFIAMIVAAMIYAKGYEGGSGIGEGARFGLLLGIFVSFAFAGVNYATLNVGRKIAVMTAAAGFFEWLIAGTIIGLVYKSAARSPR
jgi:hypothetical protein